MTDANLNFGLGGIDLHTDKQGPNPKYYKLGVRGNKPAFKMLLMAQALTVNMTELAEDLAVSKTRDIRIKSSNFHVGIKYKFLKVFDAIA